jgi:ribosomal protein L35
MKTRKSFTHRIKITKRGKIVRRPMNVDHFKTTKSKKNLRARRKNRSLDYPIKKL